MTLQQVIDDLKAKAAEYKKNAEDKRETPQGEAVELWAADALLERATVYEQALAAEEKGHQQQIDEQRIAQHRARQEYSND